MKVTNLIATLVRDGAQVVSKQRPSDMNPNALEDAIEWLCRTHDATGRQGSSKGYSLLHGWLPAYPETTGYVLEVLLWHALRQGDRQDLVDRAKEMGDWEVSVQSPDGGIMEGELTGTHRRSVIFNTGQVLHGWMTLTELGHSGYEEAARRDARFLMVNMQKDGTWNSAVEYGEIPHTYNTRVAWAMLRYAADTGS